MWSLRRTENPRELDRNQPAPQHGDDSSAGQNAGLWIRRSRVRSPFFTQTMEAWVSGRNHLSAKEAVLRGSKVRIFPFPHYARMVKWLTRRSAKPLLAGSNPAPGSHRELAQWSARKPYTLTVSGSSPEFPTNQEFYISLHPQKQSITDMANNIHICSCQHSSFRRCAAVAVSGSVCRFHRFSCGN